MEISLEDILQIVKQKVKVLGEENDNKNLINCSEHTRLYSPQGNLDSLKLVFLVSELEEAIEEQYDLVITLADERAMSQKISPFRTVGSLSHFIYNQLSQDE